jgi:uncharacterized coiled-coil protein SlyX
VPSATEMQQTGINVAKSSVMLMEKVEELTLYLIQQQELLEKLQLQLTQQQQLIEKQQVQINSLMNK